MALSRVRIILSLLLCSLLVHGVFGEWIDCEVAGNASGVYDGATNDGICGGCEVGGDNEVHHGYFLDCQGPLCSVDVKFSRNITKFRMSDIGDLGSHGAGNKTWGLNYQVPGIDGVPNINWATPPTWVQKDYTLPAGQKATIRYDPGGGYTWYHLWCVQGWSADSEYAPTCDFQYTNASGKVPFHETIADMSEFWTYGVYQLAYLNGTIIQQWDDTEPQHFYEIDIDKTGYLDLSLHALNDQGSCTRNYTIYAYSLPNVTQTLTPIATIPTYDNSSLPLIPDIANATLVGAFICSNASALCPIVDIVNGIENTFNNIIMFVVNGIVGQLSLVISSVTVAEYNIQYIVILFSGSMAFITYAISIIFDAVGVKVEYIAILVLSLDIGWTVMEEFLKYRKWWSS